MEIYIVEKQNKIQKPKPKQNRQPKLNCNFLKISSWSQPTSHMYISIVSWSEKRCRTDSMLGKKASWSPSSWGKISAVHISDLFYLVWNWKYDNKNIYTVVLRILMNIGRHIYMGNKEVFSVMIFKYFHIHRLVKSPFKISGGTNELFFSITLLFSTAKMTYSLKKRIITLIFITLTHLMSFNHQILLISDASNISK